MPRSRAVALLAALLVLPFGGVGALAQTKPVTVFAAASLTDAMQAVGASYKARTGADVRFSFASSSTLARQIEAGAPAQLFVSADKAWMDYVQARKLIRNDTRRDILGNRLVLIAPAGSTVKLKIAPGFDLAGALGQGRLAVGDPSHVPAGLYAKAALSRLGAWDRVQSRLAPAENVRAALAYVARGEAPLGIVYWTDALSEPKVRIVATFPETSHPPITYPVALTTGASPAARGFYDYLRSAEARALFKRLGFSVR